MITCSKKELMTEGEFSLLRDLINKKFGILLRGDKRLTLHTKVSHRLPVLGLTSYQDYYDYLMADSSGEELSTLASHITNNETYFFRETKQLDVFSGFLDELKRQRQERNQNILRVLSLASSSGEEAYSLNIIIQESGLFVWNWDIKTIGIDIDKNVIKKAREASYTNNSFRLNGNIDLVNKVDKYFTTDGPRYILRRSLTNNVEFRYGNILENNSFIGLHCIDAIFCRNVLIYMSDEAIAKITLNLYNSLSDWGYLFIGSTESLIQRTDLFVPEYTNGIIVYRKNVKN